MKLNKPIKHFFVLLFLLILWMSLVVGYIKTENLGLLTLDTRGKYDQLKGVPPRREIFKGDIVSGEFLDRYPNLGIIGIRFSNQNRINEDVLEFRLKKAGADKWYYKARYNTDQFQPNGIFPIGFPPIEDSAKKKYYFEIESLHGATDSAIAISMEFPTIVGRHVFTKDSIFKNGNLFTYFVIKKVSNLFEAPGFTFHFIVYSLPFLFYVFFTIFGRTFHIPALIALTAIVVDILFLPISNDFLILSLIFVWMLPIVKFKIESRVSGSIAVMLLPTFALFFSLGLINYAEATATWAHLFFSIAVVQKIYESVARPVNLTRYKEFWSGCGYFITIIYFIILGEMRIAIEKAGHGVKWHNKPSSDVVLLLMIQRLGKPIAVSRIYTTKALSILIYLVILAIRLSIMYSPYVLFLWLLRLQITRFQGYYNFYYDFFIANQASLFWSQAGIFMAILFIILFIIYLFIQRKHNLRTKTLLAIIFLFISINLTQSVFDKATHFRYGAALWSVLPNDTAEPWVDVSLVGRNFKNLPFVGKVTVSGVEHRVITWSDSLIVFRTDPMVTKSGPVKVVSYDGRESNEMEFVYKGNR